MSAAEGRTWGEAPRILVSACLLGHPVRFDGGAKPCASPILARWVAEGWVVPVCPEQAGGLDTPRPPGELQPDGRVRTADGTDLTEAFLEGAQATLDLARRIGAVLAILKEGSPSCGSGFVHDGTFRGRRRPGQGMTASLLRAHGIPVFSEEALEEAQAWLEAH